tara:strand:- start:153 stop:500 length:348 start_codon:yes stop_codon:yes gene_type:complete
MSMMQAQPGFERNHLWFASLSRGCPNIVLVKNQFLADQKPVFRWSRKREFKKFACPETMRRIAHSVKRSRQIASRLVQTRKSAPTKTRVRFSCESFRMDKEYIPAAIVQLYHGQT